MKVSSLLRIVSIVFALLAAAAHAQEDPLKATHGDWQVRCPANGTCYMSQIVNNDAGAPLLAAAIQRIPAQGGAAAQVRAMMRVQAPLGVLLPRGLEMRIDGGDPVGTPFLYCDGSGCVAQVGLADEGLTTLRRGASAVFTIFSIQEPEKAVQARLSLRGFTRAYDELN